MFGGNKNFSYMTIEHTKQYHSTLHISQQDYCRKNNKKPEKERYP